MSHSRFQLGVDALLALSAVTVAAVLVMNYVRRPAEHPEPQAHAYAIGDSLPTVTGVDYSAARRTAVLVLRSTCQVCTDSMSFYRTLVEKSTASEAQVVVLGRETTDELSSYLRMHNIDEKIVAIASSQDLQVFATPIVFIVDSRGEIVNIWVGRLRSGEEAEVVKVLLG